MKLQIRRGTFGRWTVYEPDGTATQFRTFAQAVTHADEIARRRPYIEAALTLCDLHMRDHAETITMLAEKWTDRENR